MRIGIDISQLVYKGSGVSRFMKGLVKTICENDQENNWIFFFSSLRRSLEKDVEKQISKKGFNLIKYPLPPTLLSLLWNNMHVIKIEQLIGKLDWFITSDWTEPPTNCKKATIVHDLAFLRYPETVDGKIRKTQFKRLERVKKESKIIFADSKATKNDLVKFLDILNSRIVVNYPGVEINKPKQQQINKSLTKFKIKKSFILSVGKIEPRKNIKKLIEAFVQLKTNKYELLIVGPEGWGAKPNSLRNVRFLGYVSDEELSALYSRCICFAYPSIWEGFGYPIIEAMKLGTPVATSNNSSLKEIGDGAALLFDPFNISDIKRALKKMIEDGDLRNELIKKGSERAKIFAWKKYYQTMIKSLKNEN